MTTTTLAEFRSRVRIEMADTAISKGSVLVWDDESVDHALRQTLAEISNVRPSETDTVLVLIGDGTEIALNAIEGLRNVLNVHWPYNSLLRLSQQENNEAISYTLRFDEDQPYLVIDELDDDSHEPATGDEMRIWYTRNQTIDGLDSASATTLQYDLEHLVVMGAAGRVATQRSNELVNTEGSDMSAAIVIGTWGKGALTNFRSALARLAPLPQHLAKPQTKQASSWALDKYDEFS